MVVRINEDLKIKVDSDISKAITSLKYVDSELKKLSKSSKSTSDSVKSTSKKVKESSKSYLSMGSSVKKSDSKMRKFTTTMNKNAGGLRRLGTDANRTATEFDRLSKTISSLGLGKLTAIYGLSKTFTAAVQGASDVIETINLFNVSMGQFAVSSGNYLNRISESAGLDPTFLQQATANYSLLARSMGFTNNNANILSKSVTNLGIDLSSLMNVPLEQVMSDLRSGLLGQTETVYKYGIDLTEASLKQEALRLGIEKSVSVMSQAEKMMLRYSVMLNRTSLAQGDFAKTIETPANQLRIFTQQVTLLSRTIGTLFINSLGRVLPYINGFIMAIRVLIETISALLGYESPKFEDMSNGFGSVTDSSNDLGDSIDNNKGKAEKLKKAIKDLTLGFDELNILPSVSDTSSPSGVGGVGGVGGELPMPDLTAYTAQLENVRMKATQIRDKILEWLGFTKVVDEETGKVNWKLKDGYTRLELIRDIVKAIGIGFLTWKIVGIMSSLTPILTTLLNIAKAMWTTFKVAGLWGGLKSLFSVIGLELSNIMASLAKAAGITPQNFGIATTLVFMVARIYDLYKGNEAFRTGVQRLKEIWDILWESLKNIWNWFENTFINPAINLLSKMADELLNLLPESVRKPVTDFFSTLSSIFKKLGIDFTDLLTTLGSIALLFTPAAPFGVALLVFEAITVAIRGIGGMSEESWEKVKQSVSNALDSIKNYFKELWNTIKPILEPMMLILKDLLKVLWDIVLYLGGVFIESFKFVFGFINEYIIKPFGEAWKKASEWFVENSDKIILAWELVKEKFGIVWDWIKNNIITPFGELFGKLKDSFLNIVDSLIEKWGEWYHSLKDSWETWIKPTLIAFGELLEVLWKDWIKPSLDVIIKLFGDMVGNVLNALSGLLDFITGVFTKDWELAWIGVKNIVKSIFNGIISIVESSINLLIKGVNFFIKQINKIKLPDWLGGAGFNISTISEVSLPKLEMSIKNVEDRVNDYIDKNKPSTESRSLTRSNMMSGANLISQSTAYGGEIPQINYSNLNSRQINQQSNENQSQQETIINNVLTLDGEVIYRNQQKIQSQKGYNFGNPAFAR